MSGFKQILSHKMMQKLSPQQIQFIKLLQMSTLDFEEKIDQELLDNPALDNSPETKDEKLEEQKEEYEDDYQKEDVDINDYLNNGDDGGGFRLNEDYNEEQKDIPIASQKSFQEQLVDQARSTFYNERELALALHLVNSIEDDGYLRRDLRAIVNDLAFNENVSSSLEELEKILIKIQNFDPPGIGARDLRESLLLQLYKKDYGENKAIHLAQKILINHMESFTKKHYQKIIRSLKITEEQLKEAIAEIVRLNPKPGGLGQVQAKTQYIIPDFTVVNTEGELKVLLNGRNTPDLRVNRAYSETLKNYDVANKKDKERLKDSVQYIKQKLDGAKWFIDSIRQRQHTLITTMQEIVKQQTEFFTDGDETSLKPMILKDIAEKVNLDISTISRVANSKYVETEFGMFALKFFFSEGVSNAEGEEVSNREIKKILSTAIVDENKRKPHTDEALMVLLKEKGYGIARRTVAKYREQLNIPVARLRKEI
ncbi:MAG: RNA polymerase factor sigma-54 [Bacteroidia bacterium]|jgi:RNA polymerase sigma-54 factor|nr:RNA polymerase factor sigma-54 [Bacteroidia bacterium]